MLKTTNPQLKRWLLFGLVPPVIALNVWVMMQFIGFFSSLIQIIIVAAILAFLLNYAVRLLERLRVKHIPAIVIVFLMTIAVFGILGVTLVPILLDQSSQVASRLPQWIQESQKNLKWLDAVARERNLNLDLEGFAGSIGVEATNQLKTRSQDIASLSVNIAKETMAILLNSIMVFVLSFYMLLYGDRLWRGLLRFLPVEIAQPFDRVLRMNFHGFFLSQVLLALFMTLALIPFFLWLKVPFALLFTLLIGIAELIPLIGAALGIGIVTALLMFQNVGLAFQVGFVCVALQQIRDNIIGPKLMGDITGLNPIYVFIVLLVGLQVGGLLGAFLAVPIAGTIKGTIDALQQQDDETRFRPVIAAEPPIEEPLPASEVR
jgi:predicted PurR-regulated permease PerM